MKAPCLLLAVIVGVAPVAVGQELPRTEPEAVGMSTARLERLGHALRTEIEEGRLPGAVVAIARRGRIVYHEAFGRVKPAAEAPMTKDAIFSVASMTKPLATVAALMLIEDGRLLLSDPIGKYLPQLDAMPVAVMSPDGQSILGTVAAHRKPTIQDLMRHTAGVTYGNRGTSELHEKYGDLNPQTLSAPAFLQKLGALPLHYQPGTVWDYSLGLDVLGLVVEAVTKRSLGRFLEERLFKPLRMEDTGFLVPPAKVGRYGRPFAKDPLSGNLQTIPDRTKPPVMECGGACAVSTASDYLRFAVMLLNGGAVGGERILGRKTVEFMTSDHLGSDVDVERLRTYPLIGGAYGFGLSVAVRRTAGVTPLMGSPGDFNWGGAYGTYFWVDPKEQLAVVFMAAAPGELRLRNRQLVVNLILQAIVD